MSAVIDPAEPCTAHAPAGMELICQLPDLLELHCSCREPGTDTCMQSLQALTNLTALVFTSQPSGPRITRDGLARMAALTNLRRCPSFVQQQLTALPGLPACMQCHTFWMCRMSSAGKVAQASGIHCPLWPFFPNMDISTIHGLAALVIGIWPASVVRCTAQAHGDASNHAQLVLALLYCARMPPRACEPCAQLLCNAC